MLKRFLLPLLLLLPLVAPPRPASADAVSYLFASPVQAHPGDTIWLSGAGLAPDSRYYLFVACPTWMDPSVLPNGNYRHIDMYQGPVTDGNGQFVHYRLHAFALNHRESSSCTVYAGRPGDTPFGPDIPAQYSLVPPGQRLLACAVQICGSVSMASRPARSGHHETFVISSGRLLHGAYVDAWGGAYADVTISFNVKGSKPIHWYGATDPSGVKRLSVLIPAQSAHVVTASVSASFHLGHATGKAQPVAFTVVR